jgi:hypothetical protein
MTPIATGHSTPAEANREFLRAFSGITFRYTFPKFSAKGAAGKDTGHRESNERIPAKKRDLPTSKICSLCYRPKQSLPDIGEGTSPDKCFNCGSEMFSDLQDEGISGPGDRLQGIAEMQERLDSSKPCLDHRQARCACIEETPFLKWKQVIMRAILEERYKGLSLSNTGVQSIELRYTRHSRKATPAGNNSADRFYRK